MKRMSADFTRNESKVNKRRGSSIDTITAVGADGKYVHVKTFDGAETRGVRLTTPYGLSSAPKDNMRVQTVIDESGRASVVGVDDIDKPDAAPGDTILYDDHGNMVKLTATGIDIISASNVTINGKEILVVGGTYTMTIDGTDKEVTIK